MQILFVTNIPSPYQINFFSELEKQHDINIHVIFVAASEVDRQFTVPTSTVFSSQILSSTTWSLFACDAHYVRDIKAYLTSCKKPHFVIISGSYFMPAALQVRAWAVRNRIHWIYWGENPWKKNIVSVPIWKKIYLRYFLHKASGVFGIGIKACQAYKDILGENTPVYNLPYAPDLSCLASPSEPVLQIAKKYRSSWGVDDPIIILFAGALSYRKAPDMLVRAFALIIDQYPQACLMFAGDGPLRSSLENDIKSLNLEKRTRFIGFIEGDALHAAYLASDLFVLPTRTHEGWGVVVQEALAAGLPVLVSNRVDSQYDLIDNITGRTFVAGDQESLNKELSAMLSEDALLLPLNGTARMKKAEATGSQAAAVYVANIFYSLARVLP